MSEEEDVEETGPYIGEYEGERNLREERHGHGKTILPNKDLYEGHYVNGKRDGQGLYKFKHKASKGARYTGEYYQGKKQGTGTFIYPDGSRYEGQWVDDLRDGTGKYFYTNGDVYDGEWSDGKRHGKGTYTFARDKTHYKGSWRRGKWEGYGEYTYCNYKYVGRFRDNKMFGYGKFVFDVACELHGQFVLENKDEVGAMDIEQEAMFMCADTDAMGEDGMVDMGLQLPPSPPPIGATHFVAGKLTGLHVMTPEEEEEARLVKEINDLRAKVEAQIAAKKDAERKRAEALAAKFAREEAERAALEALAQSPMAQEEEDRGGYTSQPMQPSQQDMDATELPDEIQPDEDQPA